MNEISPTLRTNPRNNSDGASEAKTLVVSVAENQRGELREAPTAPALSAGGGKPGSGYSAVRDGQKIRRLTPTERERLMGAPDSWTNPFGPSLVDAPLSFPDEDRCVVDLLPDGPREAASGDGVVVQCSEWIGNRLEAVNAD